MCYIYIAFVSSTSEKHTQIGITSSFTKLNQSGIVKCYMVMVYKAKGTNSVKYRNQEKKNLRSGVNTN